MSQGKLSWIGVIVGASIVAGGGLLFILIPLGRELAAPAPTPVSATLTLTATALPATATPDDAVAQPVVATPSSDPPTQMPSPIPTRELMLPEVAPDFTLQGAEGIEFTLSRQLAQGPVALVFFQRGGG